MTLKREIGFNLETPKMKKMKMKIGLYEENALLITKPKKTFALFSSWVQKKTWFSLKDIP